MFPGALVRVLIFLCVPRRNLSLYLFLMLPLGFDGTSNHQKTGRSAWKLSTFSTQSYNQEILKEAPIQEHLRGTKMH